jgi:hypothetical protein
MRISIRLTYGHTIHRTVHAMYTADLSSRSAERIERLLNVGWVQSHCGCDFFFPTVSDTGLRVVPTGMGVLKPSGNGLDLLPPIPQAPPQRRRVTPVPMSPYLPSSTPYCGIAGLDT